MGVREIRTDWRVTVSIVSGGHLLSHLYFLALPPLFPLLRSTFTLDSVELGLLLSAMSLGSLLQLPVGGLVDRIGPRWIFIGGLVITAMGMVLAGFAVSYPLLLGAVLVSGLGQAAFHPADYAIMDVVVEPSHEGKSFSSHTFGGYLGSAAAPLIVGSLGLAMGWRTALVISGVVGLLYALFALVALDVPEVQSQTGGGQGNLRELLTVVTHPAILGLFGFVLVLNLGSKGVQTFTTPLIVDSFELSGSIGNTTLTAFFAATAIGVLVGGVLADRYSPRWLIPVALTVASGMIWLVVGRVTPEAVLPVVGGFGLAGFCMGVVLPARDSLISDQSTVGSTGKSFGFVFTGLTVSGLIGPPILGGIVEVTSLTFSFLVIGGCFLAAGVFVAVLSTATNGA